MFLSYAPPVMPVTRRLFLPAPLLGWPRHLVLSPVPKPSLGPSSFRGCITCLSCFFLAKPGTRKVHQDISGGLGCGLLKLPIPRLTLLAVVIYHTAFPLVKSENLQKEKAKLADASILLMLHNVSVQKQALCSCDTFEASKYFNSEMLG